jgi:hypothetical protein
MVHVQVNSGESEQMIDECLTGACPIR